MKISNKQYARSLYEVVFITEAELDIKIAVKNFLKVLDKNNDLGKIEKIAKEFEVVWNREQGIIEGELVSARELGDGIVQLLNCYIVKLLKAKEVKLQKRVDENILGGFVVRAGDTVVDGSLKNNLDILKSKLTS